jgi:ferredoxin-NADP reductase
MIGVARAAESRGRSRWILEPLGLGDSIECSQPSNSFPVAEDASLHVMFAGGIVITPFLSMIEYFQRSPSIPAHFHDGGDLQGEVPFVLDHKARALILREGRAEALPVNVANAITTS